MKKYAAFLAAIWILALCAGCAGEPAAAEVAPSASGVVPASETRPLPKREYVTFTGSMSEVKLREPKPMRLPLNGAAAFCAVLRRHMSNMIPSPSTKIHHPHYAGGRRAQSAQALCAARRGSDTYRTYGERAQHSSVLWMRTLGRMVS